MLILTLPFFCDNLGLSECQLIGVVSMHGHQLYRDPNVGLTYRSSASSADQECVNSTDLTEIVCNIVCTSLPGSPNMPALSSFSVATSSRCNQPSSTALEGDSSVNCSWFGMPDRRK